MEKAVIQGKARSIGLLNYYIEELEKFSAEGKHHARPCPE